MLVAHNASFDVGFIEQNMRYQDMTPDLTSVDTVAMAAYPEARTLSEV